MLHRMRRHRRQKQCSGIHHYTCDQSKRTREEYGKTRSFPMRSGESEVLELGSTMRSVRDSQLHRPREDSYKKRSVIPDVYEPGLTRSGTRFGLRSPFRFRRGRQSRGLGGFKTLLSAGTTFIFSFILNYKQSLLHSTVIKYGRRSRRSC